MWKFSSSRITDILSARALMMRCAPVLGAFTPYQAECGVLSVVYRTSALPQTPVSKRKLAPHFCFVDYRSQRGQAGIIIKMKKKVYRSPECETVEFHMQSVLCLSNEDPGGETI